MSQTVPSEAYSKKLNDIENVAMTLPQFNFQSSNSGVTQLIVSLVVLITKLYSGHQLNHNLYLFSKPLDQLDTKFRTLRTNMRGVSVLLSRYIVCFTGHELTVYW